VLKHVTHTVIQMRHHNLRVHGMFALMANHHASGIKPLPSSDNGGSETRTQLDPTGKAIIKFRVWLNEDRLCSRITVFLNFLQTGTMDEMKTVNDSECTVPSSESYRIVLNLLLHKLASIHV